MGGMSLVWWTNVVIRLCPSLDGIPTPLVAMEFCVFRLWVSVLYVLYDVIPADMGEREYAASF